MNRPIQTLREAEAAVVNLEITLLETAVSIIRQYIDGAMTREECWVALHERCGLVRIDTFELRPKGEF